ncbi:MAG: GIY-YIG nuclease family protein [Candidatus Omnitrophica bacterium]|nr:GIY-YIG nuclease family protein [Candidatus Omnitrophota bacterium]
MIRPSFVSWHIYIVRCNDGTLYTGMTNDLVRRVTAHNTGKGCRFTRGRTPVRLLYSEKFSSKSGALKREIAVKRLTRKQKLRLIKRGREKSRTKQVLRDDLCY